MHPIKHFITITKHRHRVMRYCFHSGIRIQGLLHDLSKYGFTEFWCGAKNYAGIYSPHHNERAKKGYSAAWLHHKGRNKHHGEYWLDADPVTKQYVPVEMPNKYIVENICDRIAASEIYNKKKFTPQTVIDYFNREHFYIIMHEHTKKIVKRLLELYIANGKKYIFKFMKKNKKKKDFGLENL